MTAKIFSFLNTRVAKQFDTNFRKQYAGIGALSFLSDSGSDSEAIREAFSWDGTPEGFYYWRKVDLLWRRFLRGKGEPLSEDLDINSLDVEELKLQERFETIMETRPKLRPEDILEEFAELFGRQAFGLFKKNFEEFSRRNREGQSLEEYLQRQIKYLTVDRMVARSFTFYSSPEGSDYWRKIDDMWKQYWAARSVMRVK